MILGVDVGGTFTDLVLWEGDGLTTAKVPTTADQSEGVHFGAAELSPGGLDALLHGTTVATNALLERTGARTALVTTQGFRDVLEIGRQDRPSLYDAFEDRPEPLVDPDHRIEFDNETRSFVLPASVEAVAVSMLHAYRDAGQEELIRDLIAAHHPDLPVSVSSEVVNEFREYERTSTTVLNAYLTPVVSEYLARLEDRIRDAGIASALAVMRSSGGLLSLAEAARLPAAVLLSGPAGGVSAAASIGEALGLSTVVSFDMGGTSTDVCRIEDGAPDARYERAIGGYPCLMPSVAINTVGAGGGSIAWIDGGGSLRVGPQSAGAVPGPASYGRGGTESTVTDAHVVLGAIDPEATLGGRLRIDGTRARSVLGELGAGLDLVPEAAALGVVRVVEEVMAAAIRTVSIEQGSDPRDATLVAFGGAGGLHATALARSLDMAAVVVPPSGGVFSALGLLLSPPRIDLSRTVLVGEGEALTLGATLEETAGRASTQLAASGTRASNLQTLIDVWYLGQAHELTVPWQSHEGWGTLAWRFHEAHAERNGFSRPDDPIEAVTVRVAAIGEPAMHLSDLPAPIPSGERQAGSRMLITSSGPVDAAVWRRRGRAPDDLVEGPAVIEERDATTVLGAGERAVVHPSGALVVEW